MSALCIMFSLRVMNQTELRHSSPHGRRSLDCLAVVATFSSAPIGGYPCVFDISPAAYERCMSEVVETTNRGWIRRRLEEVVSSKCVDCAGCAVVFPRMRLYERKTSFDAGADSEVLRTSCGTTGGSTILAILVLVGVPHGRPVAVLASI